MASEEQSKNSHGITREVASNDDGLLRGFVNFFVPLILLYGLFFLSGIFSEGFFSAIYAALIFSIGSLFFATISSHKRFLAHLNFRFIFVAGFLCLLATVISVLLLISDNLTI